MYELTLPLNLDHPLSAFTRNHPSTRSIIVVEPTLESFFSFHALEASRRLQREYQRTFEEQGGGQGCGGLAVEHRYPDTCIYLNGPCECQGRRPTCRPIWQARSEFAERFPGRTRLAELWFERGRCVARGIHLEEALPSDGHPDDEGHQGTVVRRVAASRIRAKLSSRGLSPIERETLDLALDLGYFERPRGCTMEDLAAELEITKSAVAYRMNRLEKTAISRLSELRWPGRW